MEVRSHGVLGGVLWARTWRGPVGCEGLGPVGSYPEGPVGSGACGRRVLCCIQGKAMRFITNLLDVSVNSLFINWSVTFLETLGVATTPLYPLHGK